MNIRFNEGELVSLLREIVGFKAGLAITLSRLEEIMVAAPPDIQTHWPNPSSAPTRLRAEEFQAIVSWLLFRVGSLSRHSPTAHERLMLEEANAPPELKPVYRLVISAYCDHIRDQTLKRVADGKNPFTDPEPFEMTPWLEECATKGGRDAFQLALKILDYVSYDSVAFAWNRIRKIEWTDEADLDDLFRDAGVDPVHGHFFDQRYIDYLSSNFDDIGSINWRQLERLTAEFFDRQGYKVELGPGRSDGGIDVRVWRSDGQGPPLILIQCKRLKDAVEQVHVKALYADVLDENALSGLIVTTSRLQPCAARWCEAHSYKITSSERPSLRRWIERLRTSFDR